MRRKFGGSNGKPIAILAAVSISILMTSAFVSHFAAGTKMLLSNQQNATTKTPANLTSALSANMTTSQPTGNNTNSSKHNFVRTFE